MRSGPNHTYLEIELTKSGPTTQAHIKQVQKPYSLGWDITYVQKCT